MRMLLGARKDQSSDINVTPLIDVLLVLLIVFMVLPHHRGERTEIPQTDSMPLPQPEATVAVRLQASGEGKAPAVRINREEVGWDALPSRLQAIYDKRTEKSLFLEGDPEIDFQYVAEVVDIAHHAGAGRVGLLDAASRQAEHGKR